MLNLRKIFKLISYNKKLNEKLEALYMWEDDYLMVELLPKENLEFIIHETKRIEEFSREHSNGIGFTDILVIGDKPFKTIDKRIPVNKVKAIFSSTGLRRIQKVIMQDVGLLESDKVPLGYGTESFAVIIEDKADMLENIWITGETENESDKLKLKKGLLKFGKEFSFIGIDWYKTQFYDLSDEQHVEDFIRRSC